jgi:ABC-type antimicrobial peptide transport system permease subunit
MLSALLVMVQGVKVLAVGTTVGMVGAFGLSRLITSLIFGVGSSDVVTFVGVPAVLGLVALLANYLPAVRATRIDPMEALRME